MRAVVFDHPGRPEDVLQIRDLPKPIPSPGQVLIRMIASPVNPSDRLYIEGRYGLSPRLPATPGFEGVGVVEASGGGVLGWLRNGRRVAVITDGGLWAEYAIAPARRVVPIPADIPDYQAATFFVNPMTAYAIIRGVFRVPPGGWLLQTAAGSALGRMVIRLGKRYGFKTVNVIRRPDAIDDLKRLGADVVIADPGGPNPDQVRAAIGSDGIGCAMDPVGGTTAARVIDCLAPGGRLVLYGTLSGEPIPLEPRALMAGHKTVEGFWLGEYMKRQSIPKSLRMVRRVRGLIRDGVLTSEVAADYPIDRVSEAVRHAAAPAHTGKVLLRIAAPA